MQAKIMQSKIGKWMTNSRLFLLSIVLSAHMALGFAMFYADEFTGLINLEGGTHISIWHGAVIGTIAFVLGYIAIEIVQWAYIAFKLIRTAKIKDKINARSKHLSLSVIPFFGTLIQFLVLGFVVGATSVPVSGVISNSLILTFGFFLIVVGLSSTLTAMICLAEGQNWCEIRNITLGNTLLSCVCIVIAFGMSLIVSLHVMEMPVGLLITDFLEFGGHIPHGFTTALALIFALLFIVDESYTHKKLAWQIVFFTFVVLGTVQVFHLFANVWIYLIYLAILITLGKLNTSLMNETKNIAFVMLYTVYGLIFLANLPTIILPASYLSNFALPYHNSIIQELTVSIIIFLSTIVLCANNWGKRTNQIGLGFSTLTITALIVSSFAAFSPDSQVGNGDATHELRLYLNDGTNRRMIPQRFHIDHELTAFDLVMIDYENGLVQDHSRLTRVGFELLGWTPVPIPPLSHETQNNHYAVIEHFGYFIEVGDTLRDLIDNPLFTWQTTNNGEIYIVWAFAAWQRMP